MKRAFFPTQRTPTISRQPVGNSTATSRSVVTSASKRNEPCRCIFTINQCDVGQRGFVIKQSGVYKVTQDICFLAKGTLLGAIEIEADNVTIDLCGHTLRGAGQIDGELNNVHGILIQSLPDASCDARANRNTVSNVTIKNGTIENFSGAGIAAWSVDGLTVQSVKLIGNGNNNVARFTAPVFETEPQYAYAFPSAGLWAHNCSNVLISNVDALRNITNGAWYVCEKQCENVRFVDCTFKQTRPGFIQSFALAPNRCEPRAPANVISSLRAHGLYLILSRQCDQITESASLRSVCIENCKAGDMTTDVVTDGGKSTLAAGFRVFTFCEDYLDSVLFKNCTVSDIRGDGQLYGFSISSCNSLLLDNCNVTNLSALGVPIPNTLQPLAFGFFIGDILALSIQGCSVSNLRTDFVFPCVGVDCVLLDAQQHALIENCSVQDILSTAGSSIGLRFSGPGKVTCRGSVAQGLRGVDPEQISAGFIVREDVSFCVDNCLAQGSTSSGFLVLDATGSSLEDFRYNADSTDTTMDPGAGRFSLNSADITTVTQIAVSKLPDAPVAATAVLLALLGETAGPFAFSVLNVIDQGNFYTYDVLYLFGVGSLQPHENVSIVFEDGIPGVQGVLRDNKATDCATGFRYLRSGIVQFAPDVALYRNEAFCCTDDGYLFNSAALDGATPIRQWLIGAMPEPEVAGAQLDNIDIAGCQPAAERAVRAQQRRSLAQDRSLDALLARERLLAAREEHAVLEAMRASL